MYSWVIYILDQALYKYKTVPQTTVAFFLGLILLYFVTGSPLYTISHLSFSTHMLQMSILYFIIPPIILLGIPGLFFQRIENVFMIKGVRILLVTPKMALIVFAVLFFLYHLPFVLNVISLNSFLHNGYILVLFGLAFIMWWPLVTSYTEKYRCGKEKKHYAFLSGLILMPACLIFIVNALFDGAQNPLLHQFTAQLCLPSQTDSLSLLPWPFNSKFDQVIAGALMLGMHKFGLMLSLRLGDTSKIQTVLERKI